MGGEQLRTDRGAIRLNELRTPVIEEILTLVQSGAPRTIQDLLWQVVLNPPAILAAITAGGAAKGIPAWLKKLKYKFTWESQYDRDGAILNCAAFSLATWLNDGGRHTTTTTLKFNPVVARAVAQVKAIQTRFGWGAEVSMTDLEVFKTAWPKYRLTLISPNKTCPEASLALVYQGAEYVALEDRTVTEDPKKYDCVMVHHDNHWALCYSVDSLIKQFKNGGSFKFCYDCARVVKYNGGLVDDWPCHRDEVAERLAKVEGPCPRPICRGRVHSEEEKCPYTTCFICNGAKTTFEAHRCLVKPKHIRDEHPHDK